MANIITRMFSKSISKEVESRVNAELEQRSNFGTLANPNLSLFEAVGLLKNTAGVTVNAETALKISAFYSCVGSISEDIAKLPFSIQLIDSQGNKINQPSHPASLLFNQRPNAYTTPVTLKELLIERALRKGNGYLFIERNDNATPVALYFLENECVVPVIHNREIYYVVNDVLQNIHGTFSGDHIFHLRGRGNGFIGLSVIQYAQESLGSALATQDYGNKFFDSGANMTGLLTATGLKDETKLQTLKESFIASYKRDGIGAIGGETTFTKMSVDPNEAQFIETKEFSVNDVARWFRMPPEKLQKSGTTVNEYVMIQYVQDCLMPWIVRFEQEVEAKLLTYKERPIHNAKIFTAELLRGDTAAQERRAKMWFFIGAKSPNQILRSMDENTIGPEGDRRYVPVNMVPEDLVDEFWAAKTPADVPLDSADASGSGATNNNIKGEGGEN